MGTIHNITHVKRQTHIKPKTHQRSDNGQTQKQNTEIEIENFEIIVIVPFMKEKVLPITTLCFDYTIV